MRAVVDQKVAGKEVVMAAEAPRAQIIDLFEALKRSIADTKKSAAGSSDAHDDAAPMTPLPMKKAVPRKPAPKKENVG